MTDSARAGLSASLGVGHVGRSLVACRDDCPSLGLSEKGAVGWMCPCPGAIVGIVLLLSVGDRALDILTSDAACGSTVLVAETLSKLNQRG